MEEIARAGFQISEANGQYGPGHNSFTTTRDGKTDLLVYHAREYRDILGSELADPNRNTRAQVLRWKSDGTPDFGEPEADLGKVAPKPLYRDPLFDGAADPVIVYTGSFGRWYMLYTNRRANAQTTKGVEWVHGTRIGIAESLDAGVTWKYIGEADIELPPEFGGINATHWAPDVVRDDMGLFHMFLTAVPGIFEDWNHPRHIVHLTSKDLRNWRDARPVKLATDRAIDASVIRLPSGGWRMFYNNETDNKAIWYADSPDLENWTDRGKLITRPGRRRAEGIPLARQVVADHRRVERPCGLSIRRRPRLETAAGQSARRHRAKAWTMRSKALMRMCS